MQTTTALGTVVGCGWPVARPLRVASTEGTSTTTTLALRLRSRTTSGARRASRDRRRTSGYESVECIDLGGIDTVGLPWARAGNEPPPREPRHERRTRASSAQPGTGSF